MKLKIIKLNFRDSGLGSNILAVLYNSMQISEYNKDNNVYFDLKNFSYTNTSNVWDKFFYQPFDSKIKKINFLERNKNYEYLIQDLYEYKYAPLDYINKKRSEIYNNRTIVKNLRFNFNKFIKLKKNIIKKINFLIKKKLMKNKTLGVNIRGNDMFEAHAKGQRHLMNYHNYIKPLIMGKIVKEGFNKIYLATIDDNIREPFKKDFKKNLIINKTILNKKKMASDGDALSRSFFENESFKNKLLLESLIDMVCLSKTYYSYYMASNVSLVSMLMRKDFNYHFIDNHIDYSK